MKVLNMSNFMGILLYFCIAGIAVGFILLIGLFVLDFTNTRSVSGEIKGVKYSYWQKWLCCRELTLTQPDSTIKVMYDEDDHNVIGDHPLDKFRITVGEKSITYTMDGVEMTEGWDGEVLDKDEALANATVEFNQWRDDIL